MKLQNGSDMTPRQRLFAFLRHEPTDRVPMWLLFPYAPTGYYVDVQEHPEYCKIFEASKDRAIMLNRRNLGVPLFAPDVECRTETFEDDGQEVTRKTWRFDGAELTEQRRRFGSTVIRKPMLDTEADLHTFATFPIETDRQRIAQAIDEKLPRYLAERESFPERWGAMMLDLGEPINTLYHNANLEEYAIWSLTCDSQVTGLLDRLMMRCRAIYEYVLSRDLAEVYFMVGSELASPPMVSRDTFGRWIVPYARELIAMIHDAGAFAIQHYHGQIRDILPDFVTMGADALHTIEEPPVGNCLLTEAFEIVGDHLGLIGCIQYDCFRSFTPQQMRQAVHEQLRSVRGKRFMLSPSAGPYEHDPSPPVFENFHAFLAAGWNQENV